MPFSAFASRAILPALLILSSCGYIGDPLPPALNIPSRVEDLTVAERGDRLILEFTIPELTTEGLGIRRLGRVELLAGPRRGAEFNFHRWLSEAVPIDVSRLEPGPVRVELPAAKWAGQDMLFGVRLLSTRERSSAWSDLVPFSVVEPLVPPAAVTAQSVREGVRVSWKYPAQYPNLEFQLFRQSAKMGQPEPAARVAGSQWVDGATEYGVLYTYIVHAVRQTGGSEAESLASEPVSITPEDTFAPAVPSGLTASAGLGSIELAWERNEDPDLAGYRVYRAADDGAFESISDLVAVPSFSDRNIKAGGKFAYRVTAVDLLGNESEPGKPAAITAP